MTSSYTPPAKKGRKQGLCKLVCLSISRVLSEAELGGGGGGGHCGLF